MSNVCSAVSKACRRLPCRSNTVCIRGFHTLLTLAVPVVLVIKKSDLNSSFSGHISVAYAIVYTGLLLLSLVLYYAACIVDPGYVPKSVPGTSDRTEEEESLCKEEQTNRWCEYCEIEQPMRARHCNDCERCVEKYDHHCPWLETCVGERNHRFFWLFLLSKTSLIVWTIVIAWRAIQRKDSWSDWLQTNVLLVIVLGVLGLSLMAVLPLLGMHTYLMVTNQTTWEAMARSRITYLKHLSDDYNPFHMGYCANMFHFLCRCSKQKWNVLYTKSMSKIDLLDV